MGRYSSPIIVCYVGGTCGDLLSAMIDPTGAELVNTLVWHATDRSKLKKPHLFASNDDKDRYLSQVKYRSVPSHDLDYHAKRQHKFISIGTESMHSAMWAADRFRKLHRPHVWKEMQEKCGAKDENSYAQTIVDFSKLVAQHTRDVVLLDSIIEGKAVSQLEEMLGFEIDPAGVEFYHRWLECQNRP